jgi:hypothetical protein
MQFTFPPPAAPLYRLFLLLCFHRTYDIWYSTSIKVTRMCLPFNDTDLHVIVRKSVHFIFNTFLIFKRWREILTYKGLFFRKVCYTRHDVTSLVKQIEFNGQQKCRTSLRCSCLLPTVSLTVYSHQC